MTRATSTDEASPSAGTSAERSGTPVADSLPASWPELWGPVPRDALARKQLSRLRALSERLAREVHLVDHAPALAPLVGAKDLRTEPVHRWFAYKEGFSPALPPTLLDLIGAERGLVVADPFGGVATTAVALREDARVDEVRSVEYSPLAHAVGNTKLSWPSLDPARMLKNVGVALEYRVRKGGPRPQLSAFSNPDMFDAGSVDSLVSARDAITRMHGVTQLERDFLLLGLGAVVEDASKAMKDGRALRILRTRKRTRTSLVPSGGADSRRRDSVKRLLESQWIAMIEDLDSLQPRRETALRTPAVHLRGDARRLAACRMPGGGAPAFPAESVDVSVFSPPYLNFIDYSEVYKLELWLLGFVDSEARFKRLRLGTLRSHPSVKFGERPGPSPEEAEVVDLIHRLSGWVREHGGRPEVGPVIRQYFEDMHSVLAEQLRILRPGGVAACVVANSTLSRRLKSGGASMEEWRLPVLTDVLLAQLARLVGFSDVELWRARDLRPRNVRSGAARESVVVARRE